MSPAAKAATTRRIRTRARKWKAFRYNWNRNSAEAQLRDVILFSRETINWVSADAEDKNDLCALIKRRHHCWGGAAETRQYILKRLARRRHSDFIAALIQELGL